MLLDTLAPSAPLLRGRQGAAKVVSLELFFDLVYVFAVTQLSHLLVANLSPLGALQTAILWGAVWLGWQYTAWVTNWFDPDHPAMRLLLVALMGVALLVSAAIPEAFGAQGLLFAASYAAIQVGRTVFVLASLPRGHALVPNFRRMLCWLGLSALLWLAGGLGTADQRLAFWLAAVACEYVAPMVGFPVPGAGRSRTADWTIDGGHLAERCQLFVIIALGESVLATGASFARAAHPGPMLWLALAVSFAGCVAMWWMYFDTSSSDAARVIEHSDDPGRLGARFHYLHVVLIAGVIVSAVADDLVVGHPADPVKPGYALVLAGGPALYLLGNAWFKRVVYGRFPLSHGLGVLALALCVPAAPALSLLAAGCLTTAVLVAVTAWEAVAARRLRVGEAAS